jgi:protein phosphatase
MVRSENQDSFGKFPEGNLDLSLPMGQLFVVADGMGGHNAGRVASETAVRALGDTYMGGAGNDIVGALRQAFQVANSQIYDRSLADPAFAGMGTTCTALVLKDGHGVIGHIGDSRVYRITRRSITQLTNDHSKVAELVRRGIITREQSRTHPERSQLYRALGTRPNAEIDFITSVRLSGECTFLLCCDGLYNHVTEDEMQSIVLAKSPDEACATLIDLANERGGYDNITVQVIRVGATEGGLKRLLRRKRH